MAAKKASTKKKAPLKAEDEGAAQFQISGNALPRRTLEETLQIARKLREVYAGKAATAEELAQALGFNSINTNFKYLLWGASAYGLLTAESENATKRNIPSPKRPGESSLKPTLENLKKPKPRQC